MRADAKILAISHAAVRAPNRAVYRVLRERGWNVELIAPHGLKRGGLWTPQDPVDPRDPPIHKLNLCGAHPRTYRYAGLDRTLERIQPNLVIAEIDPASRTAFALCQWRRRRDARRLICQTNENLSWRWRDAIARAGLAEAPRAIAKTALHRLSRSAIDHVFTTSAEASRLFADAGFRSVAVTPMGHDPQKFRYASRARGRARDALGIDPSERVIAYFGRMVPEKGVDILVQALGRLAERPWRLMLNQFEGDAEYGRRIHQLLEQHGIDHRVVTVETRHGEIADLMRAADIVAVPSRSTPRWVEQFGRVVSEAMACGAAVVVSDSGAPKGLVGDAGLVVPEGDPAALAEALQGLLDDAAQLRALRKASLRRAKSAFTVDAQADLFDAAITAL
ncbi:MAG: glycosyltransferase family 4 protein [Pseudomonadota bacterium]